MRVLVLCEFSGTVREAFRAKGHDAWSCDLLPTEIPGQHYMENFLSPGSEILNMGWDLVIAHPPCTYLANSGVCHLYIKQGEHKYINLGRWQHMVDGAAFFKGILDLPYARICVENPIQHKHASELIGTKYTQIVQPWMFGHMEQKATCLWLKGLPKLQPTNNVKEAMLQLPKKERERLHYLSPGPDRWKERSRTYSGLAAAMADQWDF